MKASKIASGGAAMMRSTRSACPPYGPAGDCWLPLTMPSCSSVPTRLDSAWPASSSPPPRSSPMTGPGGRTLPDGALADGGKRLARAEGGAELIAAGGDPVRHRPDREAVGPQRRVVELVPADRRRDRCARRRSRAVGRDEGLVMDVLGVVEPGPPAPLAPVPFPAHQVGHDRADRLGQLLGPGAGVAEAEPFRDRYPDVNAAAAGDLHRRPHAQVLQRGAVQPGQ